MLMAPVEQTERGPVEQAEWQLVGRAGRDSVDRPEMMLQNLLLLLQRPQHRQMRTTIRVTSVVGQPPFFPAAAYPACAFGLGGPAVPLRPCRISAACRSSSAFRRASVACRSSSALRRASAWRRASAAACSSAWRTEVLDRILNLWVQRFT
jgi:hypothetical protein